MDQSAFIHLTQVYDIAIVLLIISPYIIYYLKTRTLDVHLERKYVFLIFLYSISFAIIFLVVDLIAQESSWLQIYIIRQSSEFFWITLLLLLFYLYFLSFVWNAVFLKSLVIETDLSPDILKQLISRTNKKMNLQNYPLKYQTNALGYLPGSFFSRFEFQIFQNSNPKSNIELFSSNSSRNFRILSLLSLAIFFPLLIARSIQIPFNPNDASLTASKMLSIDFVLFQRSQSIDTVFWFAIGYLILIFLGVTIAAVQENLLIEYEQKFHSLKTEQAISLPKLNIDKPELDIQEFRSKLIQKKKKSADLIERRKNEEIKRIIGDKVDIARSKDVNPEVIRLDALIRSVKNILLSTPIQKEISLEEILSLININAKTSTDEIESIIIGLIAKNEVKGEYNIWEKNYQGGTSVQRYINKSLEHPDFIKNNVQSFKIKSDGSLEIYFNKNEENTPEEKKDLSKEND
ncbi:MAG: hypothetical protein ACFFD1_11550 [Candidatus Thorarchaeota archaeon]